MPRWETAGEIVHRRHNSLEWKLEMSHFVSRPHLESYVSSPPFRYADSFWYLAKWPQDNRWMGISLCGTSSQGPVLRVRLGMRHGDGRNVRFFWGRTSPHGSYEVPRYLRARQVRDAVAEVAHEGIVTIFCEISVEPTPLLLPGEETSETSEEKTERLKSENSSMLHHPRLTLTDMVVDIRSLVDTGLDRLLDDLRALRANSEEHDITFVVRGEEISAHKLVLSARCPVFRSMFQHEMAERASGVVQVDDCDPNSFRDLLHYIYTGGTSEDSKSGVFGLFAAADKYCLEELRRECLESITRGLCSETFCDAVELAIRYSEDGLLALATEFFAKHAIEIVIDERWEAFLHGYTAEGNKLFIRALK